jgi:very-short-patch-repair endonuclease
MAAVLACGEGAALRGRSGAKLFGVRIVENGIEVAVPRPDRPRRRGIKTRTAKLAPDEVTRRDGIPVTSLARTVLDLAPELTEDQLKSVVEQARKIGMPIGQLERLVERHRRRPGTPKLRKILATRSKADNATRSELEDLLRASFKRYDIPPGEFNVLVEVRGALIEADCVWRKERVIVECDGWRDHGNAFARKRDNRRDRKAKLDGWTVFRVEWDGIDDDFADDLREALGVSAHGVRVADPSRTERLRI